MKIGITGSSGFIGKHIIDVLRVKKNISLSFFDLPQKDLLKGGEKLKRFIKDKDVIIHAAVVNRGNDADVIAGGLIITYNLISAMKDNKSKAKLIFFSSIQAEMDTICGQCKKLAEIMLEDFSKRFKIPVSIFRMTHIFGEGARPFYASVVATFCYQTVYNKKLTIHPGSRNRKMNLVYINDVVKRVVREIFTKRKKSFYFKKVSTKDEIKVGDLTKLISSFKDKKRIKLKNSFQKKLYKTYLSYE